MDSQSKLTVLAMVGTYLPGFRGGGPIRSIANLVDWLGDEISFWIITSDRDWGQKEPYRGIVPDSWQRVGKAQVRYLSPSRQSIPHVRRLLAETPADVLYLNSAFATNYAIVPLMLRRLGAIPVRPIVVAPRGELCPGALRIRSAKKHAFLAIARATGLYDCAIWQATSSEEGDDIRAAVGIGARIMNAVNLPQHCITASSSTPTKVSGVLRLVFVSRISEKKNLLGAIASLHGLPGAIQFSIYGPIEDPGYWTKCQHALGELPSNVVARYCGEVEHDRVEAALSQSHALLFPTHSENFGHVILEALGAGLLVATSDQTPWRNLSEARVGWDLPLTNERGFHDALSELSAMDETEYRARSNLARLYASSAADPDSGVDANRNLFLAAVRLARTRHVPKEPLP